MQRFRLIGLCLLLTSVGQRTFGQTLDPAFIPSNVYAPGRIYSATEQPDGKRVVAGLFSRVNGAAAASVVRFETGGGVDAPFQQNLGVVAGAYRPRVLANGQLLLTGFGGPLVAGGLTRQSVLRLNANGTGDASFDAGTGASSRGNPIFVDDILPLANGKVIVVGPFDRFNGVATNRIVRLTATGAVDPTFTPGGGASKEINIVVGLPGGQLLIGGFFTSYDGRTANGLARLNADGTLDASFVSPFLAQSETTNLVVQPDGKILVSGALFLAGSTGGRGLLRLLPTGALDSGFTPPSVLTEYTAYSYLGDAMQLQADGKILYLTDDTGNGTPGVARLNANGTADSSFQPATANATPTSLTLLASGQVLVGGSFRTFNGTANRPLVQLTATGASTGFQPIIQTGGLVQALARQPDGKLIVGGVFNEIDGQAVSGLARFNANGGLDATFLPVIINSEGVNDLALQPDGKLVVATGAAVVRYLSTGALDNTFTVTGNGNQAERLVLQPDGRVLVGRIFGGGGPAIVRLLANGANDASFAVVSSGAGSLTKVQALALQADGKIVVAGGYTPMGASNSIATAVRLQATGAVDGTFTGSEFQGAFDTFGLNSVAIQADGKVLVGGAFTGYGSASSALVARLNADGSLDTGFVPPALTGTVNKVLLQPNNRVLLAGLFAGPGLPSNLARLLTTGQADATFGPTAEPNSSVSALLVQPDGKLVVGGVFTAVGGQPDLALARITAANVLHVAAPQAVAERTEAWPVPAHGSLNVAPDPTAHAQAIDLLDALGRTVRHQEVRAGATATLPLEALPAGAYLLRVQYAEGTVMRRIQVQ